MSVLLLLDLAERKVQGYVRKVVPWESVLKRKNESKGMRKKGEIREIRRVGEGR